MRISIRISIEDIFLPYQLNLSAELIQTNPVLVEILRLALLFASLQTTGPYHESHPGGVKCDRFQEKRIL
jgi:hypothetical protein